MSSSSLLFQPLKINQLELKNRVVMGSMHTGLEEATDGFRSLSEFYAERARGGVGLIITGGFSPNWTGRLTPFAGDLCFSWQIKKHRYLTDQVHEAGAKIFLQLLHAGRYSFHPWSAAPSKLKAPISPFKPRALSEWGIRRTIRQFANSAELAKRAGYDGVEIMGSEGYLINQFLSEKTNKREDQWGGSLENRARFAREIVRAVRNKVGSDFVICFRISLMDLVQPGATLTEVIQVAQWLESDGVDVFDSGIGWHEAKVPTIYLEVPRAHFIFATEALKKAVQIPVMATNRINMPELAEKILQEKKADLISMARPFLADPDWVTKAARGESSRINTCIACNQACLDHIFQNKTASCVVNPRAGGETQYKTKKAKVSRRYAVIGGGPAGLQAALTLSEIGHQVEIFEKANQLGGQFLLASKIPGKQEFNETLRYFQNELKQKMVKIHLGAEIDLNKLVQARDHREYGQPLFDFDEIVIASGVLPRKVSIAGIEKHTLKMDEAKEPSSLGEGPRIWSYADYLRNDPKIFGPVVIVGGGPIAIDVAEKILKEFSLLQKPSSSHEGRRASALVGEMGQNLEPVSLIEGEAFNLEWGIDSTGQSGGWIFNRSRINDSPRDGADTQEGRIEVTLCQRSADRIGQGLGKTSGWIHRDYLKRKGVRLLPGIQYIEVNSKGLLVEQSGQKIQLIAKEIILCAGQVESIQKPMKYITDKEESRELIHWDYWQKRMIGGALKADRIDAKRSIREGFEWAYQQD